MTSRRTRKKRADFLYPREGTETFCISSLSVIAKIFFIPARGRKQSSPLYFSIMSPDFLYPREGTETCICLCLLVGGARFSLSLRGDGNYAMLWLVLELKRFSLSPRGDGNLPVHLYKRRRYDFLYPREGTETHVPRASFRTIRIFFIPARGRKQRRRQAVRAPQRIFFIPARGRKRKCW